MRDQQLSNEQWAKALDLFSDLVEGAEPARMIASQSDEGIRAALEDLWLQHQKAEKRHFLEDQITMVRELTAASVDAFVPDEILDGRFTILRVLGRGGMGEVYLAADRLSNEMVALKTIRREFAGDEENRARFRAEVQSSRCVTHPNVCRIFDIFEHRGTPFFSMKYVAGPTLAEVLAAGPLTPERGKSIAIQVADGLSTAHKEGILHCDLKPANIILEGSGKKERAVITDFGLARALERTDSIRAGTPAYMAPELLRGQPPTVRTDIYAFGKVLEVILPKHRLVLECLAADAGRRPESMASVLKELNGGWTRRRIVTSGLLLGGTSWFLGRSIRPYEPAIPLGSQQRVHVNGFTADSPETAQIVRNLFVMALRQSSLVSILGDSDYQLPDKPKVLSAGLALPTADLLAVAHHQKAGLAIDGKLEKMGNGFRLTIQVYDPGDSKPRYQSEFPSGDQRRLVLLAEQAATDLRKAFGESSPHSTYMPLERITSRSPEALDCYFRAVARYEKGENEAALTLLDQAIALDPDFVLGHHYRALALLSVDDLDGALASEEKARAKRLSVTERERNWIDGQYASLIRDFDSCASAMHRNTVLFPDEAIFQRQCAAALMRRGRYDEAIPYNWKAVELDPFSNANTSELVVNLAEANRLDECFAEVDKLNAEDRSNSHIPRGLALAYLQAGDYEKAISAFGQFGHTMQLGPEALAKSMAPLVMLGRFSETILASENYLAIPATSKEYTCIVRNTLGQLYRLQGNAGLAARQAEYLVNLPALATNLIHLREGCALAFDLKQSALLEQGLVSLSKISEEWPSAHSRSAVWLTQAMLHDLQGNSDAGKLFVRAKIEWPDPLNLIYAAQWEGKSDQAEAQLADLNELERLSGKIYKYHFPGLVVLSWLEKARCLRKLSEFGEALRMYDRVVSHWGKSHAAENLISQARGERDELKRRLR
jgi:serine/threonine protein kinase/Flp pilus assembly protein TadD